MAKYIRLKTTRTATLVQDIGDFLVVLSPMVVDIFNRAENRYICDNLFIGNFFWWLMCRQISAISNYEPKSFNYRDRNFETLYYQLRDMFPTIDTFFTHYVKVPHLYNDLGIDVQLTGRSIVIKYVTSSPWGVNHSD